MQDSPSYMRRWLGGEVSFTRSHQTSLNTMIILNTSPSCTKASHGRSIAPRGVISLCVVVLKLKHLLIWMRWNVGVNLHAIQPGHTHIGRIVLTCSTIPLRVCCLCRHVSMIRGVPSCARAKNRGRLKAPLRICYGVVELRCRWAPNVG